MEVISDTLFNSAFQGFTWNSLKETLNRRFIEKGIQLPFSAFKKQNR